jgi:glycosyltransferase involved in cell wall biosynthesis
MQLLIIGDAYPPLNTSAAVQLRDLADEFVRQGLRVTVICPSSSLNAPYLIEEINKVTIIRLATLKLKDISRFWRAVNESLLPFIMLYRLRQIPPNLIRADGIIWYSPTIFFGPLVYLLKRKNNCKTYLILRDLFPDMAVDLGIIKKSIIYYYFKLVECFQYSIADTIGVQSPSNLFHLKSWKNINRNIEVLDNWLAEGAILETNIIDNNKICSGKFIFVYAGNMGVLQNVDIALELAGYLGRYEDVALLFIGRGTEVNRLKYEISELGLQNIVILDEIDSVAIPGLLSQCHVGLIFLDTRHKSSNLPGKLITYLYAGLPILARINPGNDMAQFISDENVGFTYTGTSAYEFFTLAESLYLNQSLRKNMSDHGKVVGRKFFAPNLACKKISLGLSVRR